MKLTCTQTATEKQENKKSGMNISDKAISPLSAAPVHSQVPGVVFLTELLRFSLYYSFISTTE